MNRIPIPVELNKGRIKFGKLLIRPVRQNITCPLTRYQVEDGAYCYGKFDSRNQALMYCRQLHRIKIHERIKEDAAQI
ncbi:hypothetical protein ABLA30_05275 [Xenorhabdus nematophila]|uniref:Uncharacterized protein n=1 Tax=Xenorhabdus nematophila (strain ATCC 19061 / DSM 3370 / CCUG 14189 / LMG 1036 / NCIMB 9965 / AN6) TaxID=406817 RepID=D3VKP3_XENNA|nr:hypothetical protein XNC1_3097 [Xenorhabdus nematophila ATCC 19061]CEK23972.1 hypothetical protein XNC2_2978 [Xenorhabdus nematophila AN6/1]